jgi:hypothetical protein
LRADGRRETARHEFGSVTIPTTHHRRARNVR